MSDPSGNKDLKWDKPVFEEAFLVDHKHDYIKTPKNYGSQSDENCIICRIIKKDPTTPSFEVCRTENFIVFLNLYPYTNAHLLISPITHLLGYEEFNPQTLVELNSLTQRSINVLKHNGNTDSLNVGWNQGILSGGSIKHFHIHLVPRYKTEMNFIEIIARTRPFIRSLEDTLSDLKRYSDYLLGHTSFDECLANIS